MISLSQGGQHSLGLSASSAPSSFCCFLLFKSFRKGRTEKFKRSYQDGMTAHSPAHPLPWKDRPDEKQVTKSSTAPAFNYSCLVS